MWLGYVRRGFWGACAAAVPFILPPFIIVSAVAALYVAFRGTTIIQALFYGVGPAVIALILRGARRLGRVTGEDERRLWGVFAVGGAGSFVGRRGGAGVLIFLGPGGGPVCAPPGSVGR